MRSCFFATCLLLGILLIPFPVIRIKKASIPRLAVWTVNPMVRVGRNAEPGDGHLIYLEAARNEWEPFQIVVSALEGDLSNVNVDVTDLVMVGNSNAFISRRDHIFLYLEHYIRVSNSSPYSPLAPGDIPDILIPFRDPYTGEDLNGDIYDAVPFNLSNGENQPIWVDIYVPPDTPPGVYVGNISVAAEGCQEASLPVILRVWPFTLPKTPRQRSYFGINQNLIAHEYGLKPHQGGATLYILLRRYYDLLLDHRLMPDLPADVIPVVDVESGEADYEAAIYPGLGPAASNLNYYMEIRGMNSIQLPLWEDWPYPHALTFQRNLTMRYIAECLKFFSSKGWSDRVYAYIVDEPGSASEYQLVREWGGLFDEVEEKYGVHVDFLVTEQPVPDVESWGSLVGYVDIWVPIAAAVWVDEDYYGSHAISQRIKEGEEIWCYTALVQPSRTWFRVNNWPKKLVEDYPPIWLLDYPPMNYRILSWINQYYGITGILYWNVAYWRETSDAWLEAGTYHIGGETFNGEGCLIYPAHEDTVGFDGPVASMRLKYIREGFEDYDYIGILRGLNQEAADRLLKLLVRGMCDWDSSPEHLYKVRREIALAIIKAMGNVSLALSDIQGWSRKHEIAIVVGSERCHGPFHNRSKMDLEASRLIASKMGAAKIFQDTELSEYNPKDGTVEWTSRRESYNYIFAVGGPIVNQITYKFTPLSIFPFLEEYEAGSRMLEILIGDGEIFRGYINSSSSNIVLEYSNGTLKTLGKIGSADLIIFEAFYDQETGRKVAVLYGLSRYGTLAGCKWFEENYEAMIKLISDSRAAVLLWLDDGDRIPEAEEVTILIKI